MRNGWMFGAVLRMAAWVALVSVASEAVPPSRLGPVFDIPRIEKITVDGDASDWGDQGLLVPLLADTTGQPASARNFAARLRVGWNEAGLLLLVEAKDDQAVESTDDASLHTGDCVELFVTGGIGEVDTYQWLIAPGCDPAQKKSRMTFNDLRVNTKDPTRKPHLEYQCRKTDQGYVLEALMSWASLARQPKLGQELALQVYVNNAAQGVPKRRYAWHHQADTYSDPEGLQRLRLAESPTKMPAAVVTFTSSTSQPARMSVVGEATLAGHTARFIQASQPAREIKLTSSGDAAVASYLPTTRPATEESVQVSLDGVQLAVVNLSPALIGRWERSILKFEAADKISFPAPDQVLLLGSSTFTGWLTADEDLAGIPLIRRGFGGSGIGDTNRYMQRIVLPYKPRAVVVYSGGNDIGAGKSAEYVAAQFQKFVETVHQELPQCRVYFLSLKPTLRREKNIPEEQKANRLIQSYVTGVKNAGYIDCTVGLTDSDGRPDPKYLKADKLHPSPEGYKLMAEAIRKALIADGVIGK